jgi:hypothetical protein
LEDIVRLLGPLATRPVCRSVGPAKRADAGFRHTTLRHTSDPLVTKFLLQSSNEWAACSGFCRTRRAIERDQCFGVWQEPWGREGDAKKAVPAVPTVVHGGFRVGMLMFRGLLSENCLDGTLRLIRGSHPLDSRLEQIEGRCNKTHKRGNGFGSGGPNTGAFQRSENKLEWKK